ncbi:MAG: hypothetical protein HPY87_09015 [Fervidobacterium sp.]|uniref:XF1762 family protein n=1 Tax=Fervidobacterium sp. TaxID=1871331 RepID=UPI0025B8A4EE|nr:XF1762 family protein [Fervidobacterium sp.]NPU90001.1 hypothetical protein [Fervidobacterium sp.]
MPKLNLQPIDYKTACEFILAHHRHHLPPQGWKFGVAVNNGEKIVGVVMVGRPVNRYLDDGNTLEVTRCCTDGTRNAASMLYASAWRAAKAMGYKRMITYTLAEEIGTTLKAVGWKPLYLTRGGSWNCKSRAREDKHPTSPKLIWEIKNERQNSAV